MIEVKTNTRPPVMPNETLSLTEWGERFKVSSKFKEPVIKPMSHVFNMDIFKRNLTKKKYSFLN